MNLTVDMRPRNWEDVVGLDKQVEVLRKVLAEGKPKPIILTGNYGTGKSTLAYLIAREAQGWECTSEPQVTEVNAATERGIDAIRKLVEDSWNHPMFGGRFQVIILDEAQQLTEAAQQVLLKEFEKPNNAPCIWIIATTNPEKINKGIRDRCLALPPLTELNEQDRKKLVDKAVAFTHYEGDTSEFLEQLAKSKVGSPRRVLKCFEGLYNGLTPKEAIATASLEALPEYFEIAMGVVFGQWDKDYILPWMKEKDGSPKKFKSVGEQLKALDDRLKHKAKDAAASADDEETVEEGDVEGRPDVSRAFRAITAAILKGQVYKGGAKAQKASTALFKLAHCVSSNLFDTGSEFASTVGGLFSVNQAMQGR